MPILILILIIAIFVIKKSKTKLQKTLNEKISDLNKTINEKDAIISELSKYQDIVDVKVKCDELLNNASNEAALIKKRYETILALAQVQAQKIEQQIYYKKEEYKNLLSEIENKIIEKNKYIQDSENSTKKIDREKAKLLKLKSAYDKIDYAIRKYNNLDIFNDNISEVQLTNIEQEEINSLLPTVTLKLHNLDVKDLRKAFNENNKLINEVLERYEKRYNTKANLAIYRLMVIALRAEQQNILYNLKYDKLEKSIEDVKKTTEKYLSIADDGNKQILGTITKFITEIEFFFIKSVEIEYEYYVKKEQQKAEQAALREQMKQEAEERKLLLEQQKQVEKEEEKYKLEIQKVQEQLQANLEDEEKLRQLQARIDELNNQLESVEHKKEEIISRQNGKAGYVYVISNLGSFGDNVFKVGMTRRLDPMDRVKELGDASVPFSFDVHSFIFSDDAVSLEQKLHEILNNNRVNKINLRKEFFRTNIDKLQNIVEEIDPFAEFNVTMLAEEYRQTLSLDEENSKPEIA